MTTLITAAKETKVRRDTIYFRVDCRLLVKSDAILCHAINVTCVML